MKKIIFYLFFLILLQTSCKTIKPVGPTLPPSEITYTPLPESVINVPVSINLERTFQDLDNSLQKSFGDERNVNGSLKYNWFINREPINPSLNSDASLYLIDMARWGAEAKGKNPINNQWFHLAGCNAQANIELKAKFNLNNNYSLSGIVTKQNFNLSQCRVTALNFDIAPIALNMANPIIDKNLYDFNQKIDQYNFKSQFEFIWANLSKTINLPNIGYLTINPLAIGLVNLSGNNRTLNFNAGLMAKPVISLINPATPDILPLPELSSIKGSGFSVYTDLLLQYPELTSVLKKNINGKKITYLKKGYILIKDIDVIGQGNERLIIKLSFKAKYSWMTYKGNLYITCLPNFDSQNKILYISDIEFDPSTEQTLKDKGAAWILNSSLKFFLGSEVKVPIDKQIKELKEKLTIGLNRQIDNNVVLIGDVNDLEIMGVFCAKQYFQIRAKAVGNLSIKLNL